MQSVEIKLSKNENWKTKKKIKIKLIILKYDEWFINANINYLLDLKLKKINSIVTKAMPCCDIKTQMLSKRNGILI